MKTKRFAALLLSLLALFCMVSCAYLLKPSEEEMKEAIGKLLPDAYTATYIIYGPGIELDPDAEIDESWTTAHYIPVAPDYKYNSERSIRELVMKVFSADYASEMLAYAFENTDEYMSRYHEYGGVLAMDVVLKKPFDMAKEINLDTLKVVKGNSYACEVTVDATLATDEVKMIKLQLIKENDRWVFNGPAY